jgi:hypothetical protein
MPLARSAAEGHEALRRGDEIAGSQRRIIFHAQRNQAKRISSVTRTVCRLFLAVAKRGFQLSVALTVLSDRASNLTPKKELGLAVWTDRVAGIFRCPIDELPNAEVLPIAKAHTEPNGAAAAPAFANHSPLTLSGLGRLTPRGRGHSTCCRRRCFRRRSRLLEATKQKIKRTFGTDAVRDCRDC